MNKLALRIANEIAGQRIKLTELVDNPHLSGDEKAVVAKLLREKIERGNALENGTDWLRNSGLTTEENKVLFAAVQRELGRVRS